MMNDLWIPCEERMPEHTSDYLVIVGVNYEGEGMNDYVRVALYNIVFKDWFVRETDRAIVGQPIAWMPLPQPYGTNE